MTRYPQHGQIGYLQLPAVDIAQSAAFYEAVFGWSTADSGFEAPGMIGQWTTELPVAGEGGPVVWICADNLYPTLERVRTAGGVVLDRPQLDGGERWLTEITDPAGNRVGIVTQVRAPAPQPLIAVRDVEASSRWYQRLLGLGSGHGGPHYERLLADGVLVLQLHRSASPQLNVLVALRKEGSVWSRACGWVASRSPEVRLRSARPAFAERVIKRRH